MNECINNSNMVRDEINQQTKFIVCHMIKIRKNGIKYRSKSFNSLCKEGGKEEAKQIGIKRKV